MFWTILGVVFVFVACPLGYFLGRSICELYSWIGQAFRIWREQVRQEREAAKAWAVGQEVATKRLFDAVSDGRIRFSDLTAPVALGRLAKEEEEERWSVWETTWTGYMLCCGTIVWDEPAVRKISGR